jgi:hypothetical protein
MAKITDVHIRKLFRLLADGMSLFQAAQKTGIDGKTARRYWTMKRLPSNQVVRSGIGELGPIRLRTSGPRSKSS